MQWLLRVPPDRRPEIFRAEAFNTNSPDPNGRVTGLRLVPRYNFGR